MKSFFAYEMEYKDDKIRRDDIDMIPLSEKYYDNIRHDDIKMIPFSEKYYAQYERIYNECFYEMREALDIMPYNFYSDILQIKEKEDNLFLLMDDEIIIGGVGCFGTEIDDLIVNKQYQGRGYGKRLLILAIHHIREYTDDPIIIHVADWNKKALKMYLQIGFVIKQIEKIN